MENSKVLRNTSGALPSRSNASSSPSYSISDTSNTTTSCSLLPKSCAKKREAPIFIADDAGFDKSHFVIPGHYHDSIEKVLIPNGMVLDRIEKLAFDIKKHYGDEELHLICILKGSRGFFNQLLSVLNKMHTYGNPQSDMPPYLEHYVRLKSYVNTQSSGTLEVISEDLSCLNKKHVLIVEDIIDTGHTLTNFYQWLKQHAPKSIAVASLLEKRTTRSNGFLGDFVGFSVPDEFVIGFSLDYNEIFRDLDHICVLNILGQQKYHEGLN